MSHFFAHNYSSGNKRIPEKPALSSPSYTQITAISILDSLFAVKSIKVYSGCIETAMLAAQRQIKRRSGNLEMDRWGNKMFWGWSGDVKVGHWNRHGKNIHEFVENHNCLPNFELLRRTETSLFSAVSFQHVRASPWCLHCSEKYYSVLPPLFLTVPTLSLSSSNTAYISYSFSLSLSVLLSYCCRDVAKQTVIFVSWHLFTQCMLPHNRGG